MSKIVLNWSSGKDGAFALYKLLQVQAGIHALESHLNSGTGRVSMHGIREELLDLQAEAIGIPIRKVFLPEDLTMDAYSLRIKEEWLRFKEEGVKEIVFGDILLEDLKAYREKELGTVGLKAVFPLWGRDTKNLAKEMIEEGIKAKVVCVNAGVLDKSFIGRDFDLEFLNDLPAGIDPCGENGEFHTFVCDAPYFRFPLDISVGKPVLKSYSASEEGEWDWEFWYGEVEGNQR